jgi:TonB family protein
VASRAGIEGYVEIEAVVDTDGRVTQARVARSLDARLGLDDNALDVVNRSTFRPCMAIGNTPLPCLVTFEVGYFLKK